MECDHCTSECDKKDRHVKVFLGSQSRSRLDFDTFAKAVNNSSQEIVAEYVRLMNIPKMKKKIEKKKVIPRIMSGAKGESVEIPHPLMPKLEGNYIRSKAFKERMDGAPAIREDLQQPSLESYEARWVIGKHEVVADGSTTRKKLPITLVVPSLSDDQT